MQQEEGNKTGYKHSLPAEGGTAVFKIKFTYIYIYLCFKIKINKRLNICRKSQTHSFTESGLQTNWSSSYKKV